VAPGRVVDAAVPDAALQGARRRNRAERLTRDCVLTVDPIDAASRWARVWHDAWEARDTEAIVALYVPDVRFSTEAFHTAYRGREGVRDYVSQAFAEEREPRVWVGAPIVDGDRAAIEWWAAVTENGIEITLSGVSILRFDAEGLVVEQWDSWNQREGRRSPPPGWGARIASAGG
jgi:nuclear transport factor 2 (NTF2) superfamily protein